MRVFIFMTCCLVVAVVAYPEAGYNYNGLQQNQNQRVLPKNGHALTPHIHQQLPEQHSFTGFGSAPQTAYAAPNLAGVEQLATPVAPEENLPATVQPLPTAEQDSYNEAYQQSGVAHESGYAYAPQQTKIHKHIYVHVPPKDFEDEDVIETRVRHQEGDKQKHYKIVFIKAPAPPVVRAPVIPPPPENEEKTLIYVLHKKPDAMKDIIIPTAAPTKPSKPEVYFIKYKTRKEQAPVYGPPPAPIADMDPRHTDAASDFGAPTADAFAPLDNGDFSAPLATIQPVAEEHQSANEVPADSFDAPTMSAFAADEALPTAAAAPVPLPNNKYLAPIPSTLAPIVVEEPHTPSSRYGPPNRFLIKKKK